MLRQLIVSALTCLTLASCAPTPVPVVVDTVPIARPNIVLPKVQSLALKDVKWIVLTPDNITSVLASSNTQVFYALTSEGYKNLALNTVDLRAFIEQQKVIIQAYDSYYANQ